MSAGNGVIRIGNRGVTKFEIEFEDEGKIDTVAVSLDVIKVDAFRADLDASFRDKDGVVPKEKAIEHREAWLNFSREAIKRYAVDEAKAAKAADSMSDAACLAIHKHITEEVEKLKDFFAVTTVKEESPQPVTEVKYSQ